jgi:hypothetical protein
MFECRAVDAGIGYQREAEVVLLATDLGIGIDGQQFRINRAGIVLIKAVQPGLDVAGITQGPLQLCGKLIDTMGIETEGGDLTASQFGIGQTDIEFQINSPLFQRMNRHAEQPLCSRLVGSRQAIIRSQVAVSQQGLP